MERLDASVAFSTAPFHAGRSSKVMEALLCGQKLESSGTTIGLLFLVKKSYNFLVLQMQSNFVLFKKRNSVGADKTRNKKDET